MNKKIKKFLKSIIDISDDSPLEITKQTFLNDLKGFVENDEKKKKELFDLAWDARKFEIEMYWKRANYYWAFQALVFVGYFTVLGIEKLEENTKYDFLYLINCIGVITSLGWYLINIGSKSWQRHWEKIIDLIEDDIIGKLYKTGTERKTFSVSKINELISFSFSIVWIGLSINQILVNHLNFNHKIDSIIIISTLFTSIICISMCFGKGRGRFGKRHIKLYRREIATL